LPEKEGIFSVQVVLSNFLEIMRNYNVWQLARAIAFLEETTTTCDRVCRESGNSRVPDERMNNYYVPSLRLCNVECGQLELAAALARFDHFNREIRAGISWSELGNQTKVLHEAIHADLRYRRFAFVPTAKATEHDEFGLRWEPIWAQFPDSKEDSQRAIDCYALEQNTACVFHMMRVAEIGLRAIAQKVRVKLTDSGKPLPAEFATWNKVIDGIKSRIATSRAKPKSERQNKQLQFYADAADECTFIRDIWRNEVSHTRKGYNEVEAMGVIIRVRDFMELLAKGQP
jgi:hypothetical protein